MELSRAPSRDALRTKSALDPPSRTFLWLLNIPILTGLAAPGVWTFQAHFFGTQSVFCADFNSSFSSTDVSAIVRKQAD